MLRVQRINYDKLWNSWIDAMTTSMTWRQRKPARITRLSSSKCYKEWFFCLFIYLLYKNTFHDWFQRISTKTLNPWNTTQINCCTITYTRTPLCGHSLTTDTSLLRTVRGLFSLSMRKALAFSRNTTWTAVNAADNGFLFLAQSTDSRRKPTSPMWTLFYLCSAIARGEGALPYITYTGMCRPTGSWFWSSWFRTGYPFPRRFLERGIKNCGSGLYLLLKIVADYEEAFIWCISRTNKEISF